MAVPVRAEAVGDAFTFVAPDEEADLLRRRFYDGATQTEIAAETGVPLGTVKMRMVQGLARLRDLLDAEERGA